MNTAVDSPLATVVPALGRLRATCALHCSFQWPWRSPGANSPLDWLYPGLLIPLALPSLTSLQRTPEALACTDLAFASWHMRLVAKEHSSKHASTHARTHARSKNQAFAAVFFAATFLPAAGGFAARGSNANITLPSFLS